MGSKAPYDFKQAFAATIDVVSNSKPKEFVDDVDGLCKFSHAMATKWMSIIRCGNYCVEACEKVFENSEFATLTDFYPVSAMPYCKYQPYDNKVLIFGNIKVLQWYYGLEEVTADGLIFNLSVYGKQGSEKLIFSSGCRMSYACKFETLDVAFSRHEKNMLHDIFLLTMLTNNLYHQRQKEWAAVVEREERKSSGKKRGKKYKHGFKHRELKLIRNLSAADMSPKITYLSDIILESERKEKLLEEALKSGDEKSESWWKQHYRIYWINPANKELKRALYEAAGREVVFFDDITRGDRIAMLLEFKRKLPPTK